MRRDKRSLILFYSEVVAPLKVDSVSQVVAAVNPSGNNGTEI